jgi:hypothetical protein
MMKPIYSLAFALVGAAVAAMATGGQTQPPDQSPRIVAAGTATWQLGKVQDNATSVHVSLRDDIASRLGDDYIVLLTMRNGGYPYYSAYWKKAKNGFDITLIDPAIAPGGNVSYIFNVNRTFLVDWMVVKK